MSAACYTSCFKALLDSTRRFISILTRLSMAKKRNALYKTNLFAIRLSITDLIRRCNLRLRHAF